MSLKTTIITTIMTQHVSISIPQHKDILLLSEVKENMHISLKPGKKNQMVLVPARTAFSSRTTLFLIFIDEIFSWFSICQITKSIHRHIRCANILVLNIYPPHTPPYSTLATLVESPLSTTNYFIPQEQGILLVDLFGCLL